MMFTEHGTAAPAPVHHVHHVPPPPATVHPAAAAVAQLALQHAAAPQAHHSALAAHVATAILRATGHAAPARPGPSRAQPKVSPRAMQAAVMGAMAQSVPQGSSMWGNLGMFDPRAGMQDIVNSISGIGDTVGGAVESPYDWLQSLFGGGGYSMQNAVRKAQASGGNGTINVFHPSP